MALLIAISVFLTAYDLGAKSFPSPPLALALERTRQETGGFQMPGTVWDDEEDSEFGIR